jgi:hypothetical protein
MEERRESGLTLEEEVLHVVIMSEWCVKKKKKKK